MLRAVLEKKSCALSCLLTEGEVLFSWYISVNLETACMNSGNSNVSVAVADSSQCNKMLHNCSPRLVSWLVATVRQQIHGGEPLLMLCLWKIVWDMFTRWNCVFNESAWGWKVRWKMSVSLFVSLFLCPSVCLSVRLSVCLGAQECPICSQSGLSRVCVLVSHGVGWRRTTTTGRQQRQTSSVQGLTTTCSSNRPVVVVATAAQYSRSHNDL